MAWKKNFQLDNNEDNNVYMCLIKITTFMII